MKPSFTLYFILIISRLTRPEKTNICILLKEGRRDDIISLGETQLGRSTKMFN
jgi:hypothetical protein